MRKIIEFKGKNASFPYNENRRKKIKLLLDKFKEENDLTLSSTINFISSEIGYSEHSLNNAINRKSLYISLDMINSLEDFFDLERGDLIFNVEGIKRYTYDDQILEEVYNQLLIQNPFNFFYLNEYFDYFINMKYHTFYLLIDYSDLNINNQKKFLNKLQEFQTSKNIFELYENTKQVAPLIKLSTLDPSITENSFKSLEKHYQSSKVKNIDNAIRKHLWNELQPKLLKLDERDLEKFHYMSRGIYTMNEDDWKIVICYELLSNVECESLSSEQWHLTNFINQLLESEHKKTD